MQLRIEIICKITINNEFEQKIRGGDIINVPSENNTIDKTTATIKIMQLI